MREPTRRSGNHGREDAIRTRARDPRAYDFYRDNPYALTCGHVLAIHSAKAQQFHIAAHSLARDVRLPRTNRNQV
jgi:hypothetical protein